MAILEPQTVKARGGMDVIVRSAAPGDAVEMLAVRRNVALTSEEVLTQADELPRTPRSSWGTSRKRRMPMATCC